MRFAASGASALTMHQAPVATVSTVTRPHGRRVAVVDVTGEVDLATAPELATAVHEAIGVGGDVLVDFTDCGFLDSSGVAVLVHAHRTIAERGRALLVVSPPATVPARVLSLTLSGLVPFHPTRAAALDSLGPPGGAFG